MATALGVTLFFGSFMPSICYLLYTNNLLSNTVIYGLIAAIAGVSAVAAVNFVGTGLNAAGTAILFCLSGGGIIYATLIISAGTMHLPTFGGVNYGAVLDSITTFMFVIGMFLLAVTGGHEA
jgi:hypothetical protein